MKRNILGKVVAAAVIGLGASAHATTVDLSTWQQEGGGNWNFDGDFNGVVQTLNTSQPAVLHNGVNSQGMALSGEITVQTNSDDDFVGFVLGFNAGDSTNPDADYLLIDWKQADQALNSGAFGQEGLAVSRVTGAFDFDRFWEHSGHVNELQRGFTRGATGWVNHRTYTFDLIFNPTNVQVFVDGVQELNISGSFEDGSFGFYNLSQAHVRYAGLEEEAAPPIPEPSSMVLLGMGMLGAAGWRRLRS